MKYLISIYIFSRFFFSELNSKEIECQGAKLRIINKITTEKSFFYNAFITNIGIR